MPFFTAIYSAAGRFSAYTSGQRSAHRQNLKMHMRAGTISAAADKADDLTLTHALTGRNGNPAHMPVSSFITVAVIDTYIASITAVPTGNLYRPHRTGVTARRIQQQCQPRDASRNRHRSVPYVHRRES